MMTNNNAYGILYIFCFNIKEDGVMMKIMMIIHNDKDDDDLDDVDMSY